MNSYPQKVHIDRPRNPFPGRSPLSRLLPLALLFACMAAFSWAAQAAFIPVSTSLTSESCPNGYFDPGETNTVQFVIKNDTDTDFNDVQVELLADSAIWNDGTDHVVSGSNVELRSAEPIHPTLIPMVDGRRGEPFSGNTQNWDGSSRARCPRMSSGTTKARTVREEI